MFQNAARKENKKQDEKPQMKYEIGEIVEESDEMSEIHQMKEKLKIFDPTRAQSEINKQTKLMSQIKLEMQQKLLASNIFKFDSYRAPFVHLLEQH